MTNTKDAAIQLDEPTPLSTKEQLTADLAKVKREIGFGLVFVAIGLATAIAESSTALGSASWILGPTTLLIVFLGAGYGLWLCASHGKVAVKAQRLPKGHDLFILVFAAVPSLVLLWTVFSDVLPREAEDALVAFGFTAIGLSHFVASTFHLKLAIRLNDQRP